MKVLWFSLYPSLAESYLDDKPMGGGWIKSLEKSLQTEVDLSVVFYYDKVMQPFRYGATTYYPVKNLTNGIWSKITRRLFNRLEPQKHVDQFIAIINKIQPDIIHVHGSELGFGLIQKHTTIPTVVSLQGIINVYHYKFFSKISYGDVIRYSSLKSQLLFSAYNHVYNRFSKMRKRESKIFKHTKHLIGRTAWDRRVSLVLAPQAAYYHNDEVLRDSFYTHEWSNIPGDYVELMTINGPNLYKGIETILYCANLLERSGMKFKWRVAGISPDHDIVNIAVKSTGLPLSKSVIFLGVLNEQQLVKKLMNANVYIGTSHIENSPNSLCEALLMGLPCIATHAGGTNSLIDDNYDGILIQDGDPYSMAGAIIELSSNYELAVRLGKNARIRGLARHNIEKITNDLLDIYNKVINKAQP